MLLTNHVLSGALIGALTRRPLPAFAAGLASHFVLDVIPHWGDWGSQRRFLQVAVPDGLLSLAAMGAFAAVCPGDSRLAVLAGMSGAVLPDIGKPTTVWFGWSPFPDAVDRFHGRIQREAAGRAHLELLAAGVLACAALIAIRGFRPRAAGGLSRPGSVVQNRLASAGLWGLRERSVQVSGQQKKGEGEVGGGFIT